MKQLLGAPLAAAAACAIAVTLADRLSPWIGGALALLMTLACAALARASSDRPRRLCWSAAALTACVAGVTGFVGPPPGFDLGHAGPLDSLREALADPLRRLVPEPEGGIVRGVVLGERTSIDADLAAAFARTGTTHLLAISGFNMTLVAAAVSMVVRGRLPAAATAVSTIFCVVAYSLLVGLAPSVMRAMLMAAVAACGVAFGRRPATINGLALAVAVMVAADSSAIADVGFVLSATATGGLLFLGDPLSRALSRLPSAVREGLATTLAATLPTLPIIAAVFGRVSLVSPLANLVAVPLFPPLMLAGAATAALGAVSLDLGRLPGLVTYALAAALRAVVEASAAVPFASVAVPEGPLAGLGYAAAVALALRFAPPLAVGAARSLGARLGRVRARTRLSLPPPRQRGWLAGGTAALLIAAAIILVAPPQAPTVRVRALDVGQGDAFLVEVGGRTLLIDGGPDPRRLLAELGASLPPWRRRVDVIALTHAHADHADGLIAVLERYEVGLALEPVGLNAGPVATAWSDRLTRAHVPQRAVAAGARVRIADATLVVLAPEDDPRVDVPSFVLRLDSPGFSMLFMGDATEQAQADLLLRREALASRVYVPPHHGAATPYATALVDAVRPSVALISVGARNRYGHPTAETLAALAGVTTYRTDRDGTVELDLDGSRLVVRTHANGLPPPGGGSLPHAPAAR